MIRFALAALCIALSAPAPDAGAQTLPRRAILGAAAQPAEGGLQIVDVREGSPAAAAGLAVGDLVQRMNGEPVATAQDFVAAVRARRGGQTLALNVVRDGAPRTINVRLAEAARENPFDLTVSYEAINVDDTLRRTLITSPRVGRGRRPAVLIIGGIGCYSIDDANIEHDAYRTLAYDLARRGVVVMRVEKSGMGDSQGAPCATVDFDTEIRAYEAAFTALRADRRVDPSQVFVFGHSIGSIGAPLIGQEHDAAGVIIAQGLGRTWIEYELINTRRQLEMMGLPPVQVDGAQIVKARCMGRIFLAREPIHDVIASSPRCAELVGMPASQDYMAQLTLINVAALWTELDAPALLIYGDSDFVTDLPDHQRLEALINGAHPGNATLTVLEDIDHFLVRSESQEASMARMQSGEPAGPLDPRLSATVGDWICVRARCTG